MTGLRLGRLAGRLRRKVLPLVAEWRRGAQARFGRRSGLAPTGRHSRVVVSMTTTPARLDRVHLAVESILRQDVGPDAIVLWLALPAGSRVPSTLRRQTGRGLTIRECDDVGPHTKFLYALSAYPDAVLVLADDDWLYPPTWLSDLLAAFEAAPDVVTAARARRMRWDETGGLAPYLTWPRIETPSEASFDLFPLSGTGVLYPPHLLPAESGNVSVFRHLSAGNDDVWLKAMTLLVDRPCQVAPMRRKPMTVRGSQRSALWLTNRHRNDAYVQAVWHQYALKSRYVPDSAMSARRDTHRAIPARP